MTSSEWTESWIVFNSEGRESVALCVSNGGGNNASKGTAYIKNIALEELQMDNEWNVLSLIYRNVDTGDFQNSFSDTEIEQMTRIFQNLPEDMRNLSNNRMRISALDTVIIDEPIRTLSTYYAEPTKGPGQDIDFDKYLQGHDYNLVIIYAPVRGADKSDESDTVHSWGGLGGGRYNYYKGKPIWYCTINYVREYDAVSYTVAGNSYSWAMGIVIHEILHCVESNSKYQGYSDFTPLHYSESDALHGGTLEYTEEKAGWIDWYHDIMCDTISGAQGFQPESFLVSHLPNGSF